MNMDRGQKMNPERLKVNGKEFGRHRGRKPKSQASASDRERDRQKGFTSHEFCEFAHSF